MHHKDESQGSKTLQSLLCLVLLNYGCRQKTIIAFEKLDHTNLEATYMYNLITQRHFKSRVRRHGYTPARQKLCPKLGISLKQIINQPMHT